MICLVLSFASSTSGEWYDPYVWVYGILTINPPLTIIISWSVYWFSGGTNSSAEAYTNRDGGM